MDRFRYQVTPFRPITNLIPGKSLRRPFSSDLTKEEVMLCMKCGPVFRIVPNKPPIRVTGANINQLHKENIYENASEKDVKGNVIAVVEKYKIKDTAVTEEPKTEAPTEVIPEEKQEATEEKVEEVVTEVESDSNSEESEVVEEESVTVEETKEESVAEEVVEEPEVVEEKQEEEVVTEDEEEETTEIPMGLNNPNARSQEQKEYYSEKRNTRN